ncbi:uncharacterized protein [Venturia canescens]|nr:uncharacterized protein LOC122410622 [Venturia canescens]
MPTCIVPGCTSGYVSNPEKVHFFTVPKNADSAKQWKIAVRRPDDFVKSRSAVCEKHFRKSEILWKRELLGPDGQVLGVSHYKIPRLKKGCVPSQFPWVESTEPDDTQMKNLLSPDNNHESAATAQVNITKDEAMEIPTPEDCATVTEPAPMILLEQKIPETSCPIFGFNDILTAQLNLPTGWARQATSCGDNKIVFFFIHHTVEIEGIFQTFLLKDVTIKENLSIQIRVMGLQLDPASLQLPSVITDIEQLQDLLTKIHRFNLCNGCAEPPIKPELEQLNCKAIRKDVMNKWRHAECCLLISKGRNCPYCSRAKKTLETNFRRFIQNKVKDRRKKKKDLNEQKKTLVRLQSRYRAAIKAKRLAREQIKNLKQEVFKIRKKLAECTSKDLE